MATRTIRVLSLFSGVGGLDLGVKLACRTARVVCHVEGEIPASAVLAARFADESLDDAPIWSDCRTFDARRWRGAVDCVVGGFPCTDISNAGKRAGIDGEHSGLWREYIRIVRDVEPRFVFVENVAALVGRGLDRVLGDLAESGFDAGWLCLKASDVGATHIRERLFILADSRCRRNGARQHIARASGGAANARVGREDVADGNGERFGEAWRLRQRQQEERAAAGSPFLADIALAGLEGRRQGLPIERGEAIFPPARNEYSDWASIVEYAPDLAPAIESPLRRVVDGTANRLDRLRATGNAVVPLQAAIAFVVLARRLGIWSELE